MSSATATGSCLCNSVAYSITGVDKGPVLCHCSNCQKTTGSAFANNHRFMKAKLDITKGEDKVNTYSDSNSISGNTLLRHFCSQCGSPIYLENSAFKGKGLYILYTGCMDGNMQHTKPAGELFGHNRRGWFGGVEGAAKL
ncbi:hypothetical protein LTS18_003502 [Coniosporium uncinatum]|uniref:Uncharacterized protein n=1 Tax=Coniosporium uncinatum TaxID=93489 RepID=A0ACC3DC17_9PEZI|nr:hypothetical protein LTS18_003502 [Coniosporium uncinatum]